jgi:hypothetical protein
MFNSSNAATATASFRFDGMIGLSEMLIFLVQIHADAYMLTLHRLVKADRAEFEGD